MIELSLEERIRLMAKYDFSKIGQYPSSKAGGWDSRGKIYPHGYAHAVLALRNFPSNFCHEVGNPLKSLDVLYSAYGFLMVCYASIDFKEIEGNPDFDIVRKVNSLLPRLGYAIHELAKASANSGYEFNEEVKSSAEKFKDAAKKIKDLGLEVNYRAKIRELKEQLEAKNRGETR